MADTQSSEISSSISDLQLAHIGIGEIDLQHAKLLGEFERLRFWISRGKGFGATLDALGHLNTYVTEHLEYEEDLLRQRHYPQLQEHIALHTYFRKELENLSRRLIEEDGDVSELLAFLKQWIIEHIGQADVAYARYFSDGANDVSNLASHQASKVDIDSIKVAITAHLAWRQRLEWAISGRLEGLPPTTSIRDDTACVLGHWLYSRDLQQCKYVGMDTLIATHRDFHAVAGEIVRLSQAGETASAEQLMATEYNQLSNNIIELLHALQDTMKATMQG